MKNVMTYPASFWVERVCDGIGAGMMAGRRPLDPTNAMPFPFRDGKRVLFMPDEYHFTIVVELKHEVDRRLEYDCRVARPADVAAAINRVREADNASSR